MPNLNYARQWYKYAIDDWQQFRHSSADTVYIVSFPKCGRTWLTFMLSEMVIKAYNIELDKSTIYIDKISRNHSDLPQIIQTHEDSAFTDEKGNQYDADRLFIYGGRLKYLKNKVILLVRDPRDVVVSHYYQITKRVQNYSLKLNSLSEFVHNPVYGFERIIRFYQIWNRNRWIPKSFLMIRYEDLVTDGIATLTTIVDFIGLKQISSELIEDIYEFSQAENMRKMELNGQIDGMNFLNTDKNSLKVRNAKIGSYLDDLSEDDIEYCNSLMKKLPKIYGY